MPHSSTNKLTLPRQPPILSQTGTTLEFQSCSKLDWKQEKHAIIIFKISATYVKNYFHFSTEIIFNFFYNFNFPHDSFSHNYSVNSPLLIHYKTC